MTRLHVVFTGHDATVFEHEAPSDTRARMIAYADILREHVPDSHLTYLVLTRRTMFDGALTAFSDEGVTFQPVRWAGMAGRWNLYQSLVALHQQKPIDVISPQTIFDEAVVVLWMAGPRRIPVVGQVHFDIYNSWAIAENLGSGIKRRVRLRMAAYALHRMTRIRVVGQHIQQKMNTQHGIPPERIAVIPVAVTLDHNENPVTMPRHTEVLFVGRLVPQKNLFQWLDIAHTIRKSVPDARFTLVGDGPQRGELENYVASLGLHNSVTFAGFQPYEALDVYYRRASVLLLVSHYEGFGRVIVEAALHGLPTVSVRMTGVEDIILDGETGRLHESYDTETIAESVVHLLGEQDAVQCMGQTARDHVIRVFDPKRLMEAWVDLLIQVARTSWR